MADAVQCHADLDPALVVVGLGGWDGCEVVACAAGVGVWEAKQGCGLRLLALHLLKQQRWRLG